MGLVVFERPDVLLRLLGVLAPQIGGVTELDVAVHDVDPYGGVRLALDHDAVPARVLELSAESAAEVGPGEPAHRIARGSDPLHLDAA